MTLSEAVADAYLVATGKPTTPASTSPKYLRLASLADLYQRVWQNEKDTDWDSLHLVSAAGNASTADTYDLPDEIRKLSLAPEDNVYITRPDGAETKYKIVRANQLRHYRTSNVCAQVGRTLVFSRPFVSTDPEFGGTIEVPGYGYVEPLVNPNDEVQVDDPDWLVFMMAAEFVRNDRTKSQQYNNILRQAAESMEGMKARNGAMFDVIVTADWSPPGETWV